jgi:hypothetical protein
VLAEIRTLISDRSRWPFRRRDNPRLLATRTYCDRDALVAAFERIADNISATFTPLALAQELYRGAPRGLFSAMWQLSASEDELRDCTPALHGLLHGRVLRIREIEAWARTLAMPFPRQHIDALYSQCEFVKDAEYFQCNPNAPPFDFDEIHDYSRSGIIRARCAMKRGVDALLVNVRTWYIAEAHIAFGGDERDIYAELMLVQEFTRRGVPRHAAYMWICIV